MPIKRLTSSKARPLTNQFRQKLQGTLIDPTNRIRVREIRALMFEMIISAEKGDTNPRVQFFVNHIESWVDMLEDLLRKIDEEADRLAP